MSMWSYERFKTKRLLKKIRALSQSRVHSQPTSDALKKEVVLYYRLAKIYERKAGNSKWPFAKEMALECYRAAANIDDAKAQYIVGKALLDEGKFRAYLQRGQIFANQSNERQSKALFDEALAYLLAAEKLGHIEAKRLRGLCYISGWGVDVDKKHGFELVVESIEQEDSWDKVPQIFAEMGLNKPEFFSQLTQMRNKSH